MELQNVEITKPLVEKGLGISIVPHPAVSGDRGSRNLISRRIGGRRIFRELGWIYLKSDYISYAVQGLLALFEEMKKDLTSQ
jgi:DNA-binding transcriptional LysR family regulator